jgi:hypothetical protein
MKDFDIEKYFLVTLNLGQCAVANSDTEDEISYTLHIAENRRNECPRILINIADEEIFALIDTGCEMSIFNENLYNRLRHVGLDCLELQTQHIKLVSVFNNKSRRVRKLALLEFSISNTKVDQIVTFIATSHRRHFRN